MTVLQRVVASIPLFFIIALGGLAAGTSFEPTIQSRVAPLPAPPDTVRATTESDRPLILSLPDTLSNRPVVRYTLLRGPALSGVAGRSFTWIPENASPGTREAVLRAHHDTPPADTLLVLIELES